MANDLRLNITVNDDGSATIKNFGRAIQGMEEQTDRLKNKFKQLHGALGGFSQKLSLLKVGMVGSMIAITTAMGVAMKKTLDASDAIGKMADVMGVGTSALQEYQHAAKLAGISTDELNQSFIGFNRRLGEMRA